jgi:hypothetical protein
MRAPEAFVGAGWGRTASSRIHGHWLCNADSAEYRDAGGGTRTPDTRIMIPASLGSTAPFEGAGGHERGHIRNKPRAVDGLTLALAGANRHERRLVPACRAHVLLAKVVNG